MNSKICIWKNLNTTSGSLLRLSYETNIYIYTVGETRDYLTSQNVTHFMAVALYRMIMFSSLHLLCLVIYIVEGGT
jgi:hypothetical protein